MLKIFTKLILLLLFVLPSMANAQSTATIATGASLTAIHHSGPIYRSFSSSSYQVSRFSYLYTAAELSAAGVTSNKLIQKLAWSKTTSATTGAGNFKIYIKNSSATSYPLATETWANLIAGTTLFYSNSAYSWPSTIGYIDFAGSSNFLYTGGSLEILCDWDLGTGTSSADIPFSLKTVTSSIYGTANTSGAQTTLSSTSNSIGTLTNTRPDLRITYTTSTPCTGTPAPGNTIASAPNGCGAATFDLTLQNTTAGTGVTYQWQSSPNNVTFTNVTGTSSSFTTPTISSATPVYYRCGVTCSGVTTYSTGVGVSANVSNYASLTTLPYVESFETWSNFCSTTDIPGTANNWLNTPTTGNNSWRRDDQGANAAWSSVSSYIYSPVFTVGAHSARFHSGYTTAGVQGKLDFYVNASAYSTLGLSFDYINKDGTDAFQVLLSTNGGTTFTAVGASIGVAAAWTNTSRTLPVANSATCIIRLQATADYGSTDIGIDNFSLDNLCSGTPTAGTSVASVSAPCSGGTSTLSLTGSSTTKGLTYQWQSSATGTGFANISGATSTTYTATVTNSLYYNCVVTCPSPTPSSSTSSNSQVTLSGQPPFTSLGTLPYIESFENWSNSCSVTDVPSSKWVSNPFTGNNSWRRDDQGANAAWTSPTSYIYTPVVFTTDAHSARFHSGYSTAGLQGKLDFYFNGSTYSTLGLNFDYINTSGTDAFQVLLSIDGGATFTAVGASLGVAAAWTNTFRSLPVANSATCIIRLQATADYGSTDIGIDNFKLDNVCNTTPTNGTTAATNVLPCSGSTTTLSITGASTTAGQTYQWQSSATGSGFASISGANSPTYTPTITSSMYYNCVITCPNPTPASVTTSNLQVNIFVPSTYATIGALPFDAESFENWSNRCNINDIPSTYWLNAPATGNNSWRRDDDGANAAWTSPTSYIYTPVFTVGAHSARFHSGNASNGAIGNLDYYFNGSTAANMGIAFDYINTLGSDVLTVQLSTDGGVTFNAGTIFTTASAWANKTLLLATANSATCVLRFKGTADFGTTDIGIDNLKFIEVCVGAPTAGTTLASPTTVCSGSTTSLSLSGADAKVGITYQWQSSVGGAAFANISGATSSTYIATVTGATAYQCVLTCSGNSSTSSPVSISMSVPTLCYCTTSLGGFTSPVITNVTFATLNNISGIATVTGGSNYYTSFPTPVTPLSIGATYNMSVTASTTAIVSVWIDYNKNGIFESTEWTQVYTAATTGSVAITIPTSVTPGTTGMRVRSRSSGNPNAAPDACSNFATGETEDYIVEFSSPCYSATTLSNLNVAANFLNSQCEDLSNAYTYYGTGTSYDFAIKWGPLTGALSNANAKNNAGVTIYKAGAASNISNATNSTYIQRLIWDVNVGGSANQPLTPVDVRFYYDPTDTAEIRTLAGTFGPNVSQQKWFKSLSGTFDPSNSVFNSGAGTISLDAVEELTPIFGQDPNGSKYVQFNGISHFSGGSSAITSGVLQSPLPVQFLSFNVAEFGASNKITWAANTDKQSDKFIVERSIDGIHWFTANTQKVNPSARYEFMDENPVCLSYYRIKAYDLDGKMVETATKSVLRRCNKFGISNVFPNPAAASVQVMFETLTDENVNIQIIDLNGRVLLSQNENVTTGINQKQLNIDALPSGTYMIVLQNESNKSISKFVKF